MNLNSLLVFLFDYQNGYTGAADLKCPVVGKCFISKDEKGLNFCNDI